jgi:predicted dehydrogenase
MKVVGWGLIGAGDIARKRIAPALSDLQNCEFVSVSRSRADLAEEFANEFDARKWFADWRDLVCDEEIDAVYIATPVFLHAEQAIAAAEAGKHILCEKPMALSVMECDEMISTCRANDVKLGIAYYRRFYPVITRVKEIIALGEIGIVSVAQINAFEYFDPSIEDARHWLLEKTKSGGGPMIDFGCHRLEILHNLFGPVRRIKSIVSDYVFDREVEDTAIASLQFENGVCATVTVTHAAAEQQDSLDIYGTQGSIHIPVLNSGEITIKIGSEVHKELHPTATNFHEPLIEDFANSVLQNKEPEVGGKCGRDVASMIDAIYSIQEIS